MKSKLTLIVDGNWLLMSRLAVIAERYPIIDELVRELKLLMVRSTNLVLKTFPMIDNIIFVADGGSWRNSVETIPQFLKDNGIEYKGNRTQSEDMDWDKIFESYEDFISTLSNAGITVCKERGIEGDDWCAWWSEKLNSEDTNVIIWSKDKDLTQLVKTNNNGCFTVCWNKEGGITCLDKDEDEFNFLFNNSFSINDNIFRNICNKSIVVNKINPNQVIVDKIIRGDSGDNIQPIIIKKPQSESNKRIYKVASKDILESLNVFDDDEVTRYIEQLCNSKNYKNRLFDRTVDDVVEHFKYNRTLVVLDIKNYPERVLSILRNYDSYNCCKDLSRVEHILTAKKSQIDDILDFI